MLNKPIKQGYKIFALASNGYVWHFQLLPKFSNSHFVIYIDNYFTLIPLFSMLRKENIGAARTTRPLGTDFPTLLIVLRKNWSKKLDWGTTIADIVNDVLCIGW
jgi:hypothetical protein